MNIVQINAFDFGSTGKIMFGIADTAELTSKKSYTFSANPAGKRYKKQKSERGNHSYFSSFLESNLHYILGYYTGYHGCFSKFATYRLLHKIDKIQPDIIHFHNLHSAFLNLPMLFKYVKKHSLPTIWTLHDCWAFTGQCPHFTMLNCNKWKTGCCECPQYTYYPTSRVDRAKTMWRLKKKWFTGVPNMTIVTPSEWLADLVKQSFLKEYPIEVINNGIDLEVFKFTDSDFRHKYNIENKYVILGTAFGWGVRKGLDVFIELSKRLDAKYQIVLVGTNDNVDKLLPKNIISIHRTHNQQELAEIYSAADVFVNPTREENYPTVNMEAIACGTPVVTFNTGGSPEILDETCGSVVPCDDVDALEKEIIRICVDKPYSKEACLKRAESFAVDERFEEYVKLYEKVL